MPLAAILCATAPSSDHPDIIRGQIIFAAQTLIEYQARQASAAGASELFIVVDAVTPQLSRIVDHLIGDGIEVHLIRDMTSLMRLLPRDADVLLFADGMVVNQSHVARLADVQGDALLVVEDGAETSHLERIDTLHRWAGVARLSPQTLFSTLDLIGDWDFVLTLFRATVQSAPQRILAPRSDVTEGRIALIDRQDTADLVSRSLVADTTIQAQRAGVERYLLEPVARFIAPRILRLQIPSRHISLAAIAMAALGLALMVPGWTTAGLLLFLLSLLTAIVADQVAAVGRIAGAQDGRLRLGSELLVAGGIALMGQQRGLSSDGLHMAIAVAIITVALYQKRPFSVPAWAIFTPGSAVLLLLLANGVGLIAGPVIALASLAAMLLLGRAQPTVS
ncbi:MAG: hypothetical protein E2598_11825 [Sphingobium sp.]|nr:hypothetical protein [Sphingobium sp.]